MKNKFFFKVMPSGQLEKCVIMHNFALILFIYISGIY